MTTTMTNGVTVYTDKNGVTREYREVKRRANVGELAVRCNPGGLYYLPGHPFTVTASNSIGVRRDGVSHQLYHYNYVVLEPNDIVHYDGERYREVKRKCDCGDVVLVVDTVNCDRVGGLIKHPVGTIGKVLNRSIMGNRVGVSARGKKRYVVDGDYVVLEPLASDDNIVVHDGKRYRKVNSRIAQTGDKVLILNNDTWRHAYVVGSVVTVTGVYGDSSFVARGISKNNGNNIFQMIHSSELVVLELVSTDESTQPTQPTQPSVTDRLTALEQRVTALESTQATKTNSVSGSVDIRQVADAFAKVIAKTKTYTRAEVIEMAKRDVEELLSRNYSVIEGCPHSIWFISEGGVFTVAHRGDFQIDRKKRTVVALIRSVNHGFVAHRGIAHCATDDCFNVHIGKAVALRRALGLDVPEYYTSAPKPTEAQVGDVVTFPSVKGHAEYHVISLDLKWGNLRIVKSGTYSPVGSVAYAETYDGVIIIDDSHDFGGESV